MASPAREALYDALRALDAVVDGAHAARRSVEELLASGVASDEAPSVQPLAPVVSIVDAKASDDTGTGVSVDADAVRADAASFAASVRANPHLYPHLPDYMKR